ncbi:glycosyltransferase [Desulfurococcaceae archaeon MEX13E-LK6-19]|nr:glycosyltransferase [Desulfurococcaceae archaeon MEX13E-LK6-19]
MKMSVSVVLVVHNRHKDACETIESLLKQRTPPDEIIVIDDYSKTPFVINDDIRNLLEKVKTRIRVVRTPRELGLGLARSLGVKLSRSSIVSFIDDDAIADSSWIEELMKSHSTGCDIVGGPVYPLYVKEPPEWWDERIFGSFVSIGNYYLANKLRTRKDIIQYLVWGTNFSVKREVFEKIGYFNPNLGRIKGTLLSGEEAEFVRRAYRNGFTICYNDKAGVYHKVYPYRFRQDYLVRRAWSQGATEFFIKYYVEKRKFTAIASAFRKILSLPKHVLKATKYRLQGRKTTASIYLKIMTSYRLGYILDRAK